MKRFVRCLPCFCSSFPVRTNAIAQSPQRVIIDTDPGVDDAFAILLALNSPELKVEALTVVPGNVDGRQGLENALKIASLAGRCDLRSWRSAASSQSETDYGAVLAWAEWTRRSGTACLEMQSGFALRSGSHH